MIHPIVESGEREIDDDDGVLPAGIKLADAEFSLKQRSSYTRSCEQTQQIHINTMQYANLQCNLFHGVIIPALYRILNASIF